MHRSISIAILLAVFGLTGCGKKPQTASSTGSDTTSAADNRDDAQPTKTAPPENAPPPTTDSTPATPPSPGAKPAGAAQTIPPFVVYGQNLPTEGIPAPREVGAAAPVTPGPVIQAPATLPPPPPTDTKPPEPKEKVTGSVKVIEWPKEINGKSIADFVRETVDLDPAVREAALRTLPAFGPAVRSDAKAAKAILARMESNKEGDPGVRAAAYEAAGAVSLLVPGKVGFEDPHDTAEAIRLLTVAAEKGAKGGATRLHAVQTLASFGPRAESAVPYLIGPPNSEMPAGDPAYETRRSVATTLGQIGTHDQNGPSSKALHCLTDNLIKDRSAAVRLAAYQSIVLLGPPLISQAGGKAPAQKGPAPKAVDAKAVAGYIASIKQRLTPYKSQAGEKEKPSPTGLVERDKQVEIFARLALMRLDPKECNDQNLSAIARYIADTETAPKLQALSVLGMIGELGAKKIDDVVKALSQEDLRVVQAAVTSLVSMGQYAEPAIPAITKLKDRPGTKEEKEYWAKLSDEAVRMIKEAKAASKAPKEMKKP